MKVLVANRGEIAIRIMRACKDLAIPSVAIYSEADRDALHLNFADEAHLVGDTPPAASYLNVDNILLAAKRSGATAVHPGYGFLAENAEFAQAVIDAGLVWIGPPPAAITAMGDKVSARKVAAAAGVQSVPGTLEPISGPDELKDFAEQHGWPVAIKAAFGGGGRGFRVVRQASEAAAAFEAAGREALTAFGNGALYLERYLSEPRHIEIQLLGDSHGTVVHLGERDCSLQRRHQKLLEESPSVAVDEELRAEMGGAAVRVAKAAGYHSAGTIEFLLEETSDGPRFWFLEMNTRLQVEHPVTEMVTGIDLAKQMILIASGEKLGFGQEDISFRGHAIECRINAENPAKNFLPNPGLITAYQEPSGPGVRVDSSARAGTDISPNYDSLIAKLICYGADRDEAIARTSRALEEFAIGGIRTTIPFHKLALSSDWFKQGKFSTNTVETSLDLTKLDSGSDFGGSAASGARESLPKGAATPPNPPPAFATHQAPHQRMATIEVEGKRVSIALTEKAEAARRTKPKPPDLSKSARTGGAGETLTAPMQGTIIKTLVEAGEQVKAGQAIIVLEAMKMENMVLCHSDGLVKELKVKSGDTVSAGATLAVIESG